MRDTARSRPPLGELATHSPGINIRDFRECRQESRDLYSMVSDNPCDASTRISFSWDVIFADIMLNTCKPFEKLKVLQGEVVVDIGAGTNHFGYELACAHGARMYVGVEGFEHNFRMLTAAHQERSPTSSIPRFLILEDMCSFLKRLPDRSVSIIASGIDEFVIFDRSYAADTGAQFARVLSENGIASCCAHCPLTGALAERSEFVRVQPPKGPRSRCVTWYQRKKEHQVGDGALTGAEITR